MSLTGSTNDAVVGSGFGREWLRDARWRSLLNHRVAGCLDPESARAADALTR
jgi:hypothetical protein